jgi:hypothetical protein
MTLERVVQPLVVCLGNPVAGNPTQFVMTRIARSAELDWRFFTSEVEDASLEAAFAGIKALGMSGASIFSPFAIRARDWVDSITPTAEKLGRVGVAKWESGGWIGDETTARALVRCLIYRIASLGDQRQPLPEPPSESIAVFGSFEFAAALQWELTQVPGDFSVVLCHTEVSGRSHLDETASTHTNRLDSRESTAESLQGLLSGATNSDPSLAPEEISRNPIVRCTLEAASSIGKPVRALIVEHPNEMIRMGPSQRARWLRELQWVDQPLGVLGIENFADLLARDRQSLRAELQSKSIAVIDEVEWLAYQAAADFHFWTGYEPDLDLIRESLEEYLQW